MNDTAVRYVARRAPYNEPIPAPEGDGWEIVAQEFRSSEIRIVWRRFEIFPITPATIPSPASGTHSYEGEEEGGP